MRTALTFLVCLLLISYSLWRTSSHEDHGVAHSDSAEFTPALAGSSNAATVEVSTIPLTTRTEIEVQPVGAHFNEPANHDHSPVLVPVATNAILQANKLDTLPVEMQQEIKLLAGRASSATAITEVSPGVFLNTGGPRVVPIAVVNTDGTVTIHEY